MVVFDATTLLLLLSPEVSLPIDPVTQRQVKYAKERLDFLLQELEKSRTKIIIPTPALSEVLVRAGSAGPTYLDRLGSSAAFRIVPFDQRAAVEVAIMTRAAITAGDKRGGADGTWAKIKYDRQIIAIAKVEGANTIYSDDNGVRSFAVQAGISVIRIGELPLPPEVAQGRLDLDAPEDTE
jgi:predicted nucleic acid-binding protein